VPAVEPNGRRRQIRAAATVAAREEVQRRGTRDCTPRPARRRTKPVLTYKPAPVAQARRLHASAIAAAPLKTAQSSTGGAQIRAGLRCSVSFRDRCTLPASKANTAASSSARTAVRSIEIS
jgi:hypothetical protein